MDSTTIELMWLPGCVGALHTHSTRQHPPPGRSHPRRNPRQARTPAPAGPGDGAPGRLRPFAPAFRAQGPWGIPAIRIHVIATASPPCRKAGNEHEVISSRWLAGLGITLVAVTAAACSGADGNGGGSVNGTPSPAVASGSGSESAPGVERVVHRRSCASGEGLRGIFMGGLRVYGAFPNRSSCMRRA